MAISTPAGDPAPKHLVEALLQEAALAGLGLLLDENSGGARAISTIHALVANSAVLTAWLALAGGELVVGASEPFIELASTPIAFREAETALEIARRQRRSRAQTLRLTARWFSSTRSIWPAGYWPAGGRRSSRTKYVSSRRPCN